MAEFREDIFGGVKHAFNPRHVPDEAALKATREKRDGVIAELPPEQRNIMEELSMEVETALAILLRRSDNNPELLAALKDLVHSLQTQAVYDSNDHDEILSQEKIRSLAETLKKAANSIQQD